MIAMEPTGDNRFDPDRAAQFLLEIAQERSFESVLKKIIERVVEETTNRCSRKDICLHRGTQGPACR